MSTSPSQPSTPFPDKSTVISASPSIVPASAPKPPLSSHISISKANASINRINKLLSTTSHLDLTIGTLSYTLSFLSTIFRPHPRLYISKSKTNPSRTLALLNGSQNLAALLAETRVTLRLVTGVVGIWPGLVAAFSSLPTPAPALPPTTTEARPSEQQIDRILKSLTHTSALSALVFQVLENVAFLGDKGVLNVNKGRRGRLWLYCARAWCAGLVAELARLMTEGGGWSVWDEEGERNIGCAGPEEGAGIAMTTLQEDAALSDKYHEGATLSSKNEGETVYQDGEDIIGTQQAQQKRTKALQITTLYLLMALHYSTPTGLMNESMVNLCGCVASWMGLAEAWRRVGG